MTEHTLKMEFEENTENIDKLIAEEIKRLRSLGYCRAAICERSFEIEDYATAQVMLGQSNP